MNVTNIRFKWLSQGACTLPRDTWECNTPWTKPTGDTLNKYMRMRSGWLCWYEIAQQISIPPETVFKNYFQSINQ
jgi:hypothetical protein